MTESSVNAWKAVTEGSVNTETAVTEGSVKTGKVVTEGSVKKDKGLMWRSELRLTAPATLISPENGGEEGAKF